jgi:hypothetical protein
LACSRFGTGLGQLLADELEGCVEFGDAPLDADGFALVEFAILVGWWDAALAARIHSPICASDIGIDDYLNWVLHEYDVHHFDLLLDLGHGL